MVSYNCIDYTRVSLTCIPGAWRFGYTMELEMVINCVQHPDAWRV